jgi:hypothetical protein
VNRRGLLLGLGAFVAAAPAIVPIRNLMALPRVPLVRLPSGLWVRALNLETGVEEYFDAVVETVNVESSELGVKFNVWDRALTFKNLVVGRDRHELFYCNPEARRTAMIGDSVMVVPRLA